MISVFTAKLGNRAPFWEQVGIARTFSHAQVLAENLLTLEATKWRCTNGVRDLQAIANNVWVLNVV